MMSRNAPVLDVQNIRKVFSVGGMMSQREVVALDDISFRLQGDQAQLLTIVGESGSGKTTLARCILGLTDPSAGAVRTSIPARCSPTATPPP